MIRIFVGIVLPEDLRLRLAGLGGGVPGAKWVAPENLHLTLRFIGEVEDWLADDLDAALARIRAPAFTLTFDRIDAFGSGRRPRVLWAGVERNPALERLHDGVEAAVVRQGLEAESRKFLPHVTLARLKGTAPARLGGYLSAHGGFRHGPVPVDRFTLFSSRLGKTGAVYFEEATYALEPVVTDDG